MPTDAAALAPVRFAGLPQIELVPAVPLPEPFDDPEWLFEPMYEGVPAILYHSERTTEVAVFHDLELRMQDLRIRLEAVLAGREAILTGEIVALDRQGKPLLQHLLRGEGHLAFAAHDLLWLDGADLRRHCLSARKERLAELLPEDTGPLYKVLTIDEHGRALFSAIRKLDLPGIVAKRRDDTYGPDTVWYAIRNPARPVDGRAESLRHRVRPRPLSREP